MEFWQDFCQLFDLREQSPGNLVFQTVPKDPAQLNMCGDQFEKLPS